MMIDDVCDVCDVLFCLHSDLFLDPFFVCPPIHLSNPEKARNPSTETTQILVLLGGQEKREEKVGPWASSIRRSFTAAPEN
jgi:hypothetical protein